MGNQRGERDIGQRPIVAPATDEVSSDAVWRAAGLPAVTPQPRQAALAGRLVRGWEPTRKPQ
jgi:hypothetical protein